MTLTEIKQEYESGKTEIKDYRIKMFSKYEELLSYSELIADSYVSKITMTQAGVVFTIQNKDLDGNPYEIDMDLYKKDAVAVPATILSSKDGYEPRELKMVSILCSYLGRGKTFLDIGANLGWYTLNICKQFPEIQSIAFEPIEETYFKMKRHLKMNEIVNCALYNIGLSNENKEMTFFYDTEASGASSMADLREANSTRTVCCQVKTLDSLMRDGKISGADFIKCDVEGAELLVYQGGIETIKKYKPIIFSEMLRKWSAKFGYHPNDIIDLLKVEGYQCYVIGTDEMLHQFGRVTEDTIETNYFFLHQDRHKKIMDEICKK